MMLKKSSDPSVKFVHCVLNANFKSTAKIDLFWGLNDYLYKHGDPLAARDLKDALIDTGVSMAEFSQDQECDTLDIASVYSKVSDYVEMLDLCEFVPYDFIKFIKKLSKRPLKSLNGVLCIYLYIVEK